MTTLTDFTSDYLTQSMLSRVSNTIDKREGSIIYDTITPTAVELSTYYKNLSEVQKQAYASTATGAFLDLIVAEVGLSRYSATYAQKLVSFSDDEENPISIPLGSRFSTINTETTLNYYLLSPYSNTNGEVVAGSYIAVCETLGTSGNGYTGNILPIDFIGSLATAIMSDTLQPAEDEEEDENLRTRYFEKVQSKAFGGNFAQYKEYFDEITGVGSAQIYPVWNGGGTVKASIIDTSYNVCSSDFITTVQNKIDPLAITGVATTGAGIGYAPIGHKVTIVTPTELEIDISATIVLMSGYTLTQINPLINTALSNYILELKKNWANEDILKRYSLSIYVAKINAIILGVSGVANVTNTKINNSTSDLTLTENATLQQLPKLGTVTITT